MNLFKDLSAGFGLFLDVAAVSDRFFWVLLDWLLKPFGSLLSLTFIYYTIYYILSMGGTKKFLFKECFSRYQAKTLVL